MYLNFLNYGMPLVNSIAFLVLSKFLPFLCKPFKYDERVLHFAQAFLLVIGLIGVIAQGAFIVAYGVQYLVRL